MREVKFDVWLVIDSEDGSIPWVETGWLAYEIESCERLAIETRSGLS